jgi:hypothetical protein
MVVSKRVEIESANEMLRAVKARRVERMLVLRPVSENQHITLLYGSTMETAKARTFLFEMTAY